MSLKIIGVGFGRTGTLSMQHALIELGFPCYHMFEVLENKKNKSHLDFWNQVANAPAGQQHNWEDVFAGYTATVDNPGCCVWRELVEAYPDAKIILTLHPKGPETWYESTYQTIYLSQYMWEFKLLKIIPRVRQMDNMTSKLIWERSHKNTMANKEAAIAYYNEYIEEVKRAIPKEKLMVFTVDQGWEPLCNFLGVAVPQKPFPNKNDREQIKKTILKIKSLAWLLIGTVGFIIAGLVYGLTSLIF
jgi:hypothetical protein